MKHGRFLLILHSFEEVHYIPLCDKNTYYEMVSPIELLTHFSEETGGLKVTDVVTLIGELPGYWTSNPRFPQYIMTMEKAQKKAQQSGLPTTDTWLAAFIISHPLLGNSFPNDHPEWDGKTKADQMWMA